MADLYLAECEGELTRDDAQILRKAGIELSKPGLQVTRWWAATGPLFPFPKIRQGFRLEAEDEADAKQKIAAILGRELKSLRLSKA